MKVVIHRFVGHPVLTTANSIEWTRSASCCRSSRKFSASRNRGGFGKRKVMCEEEENDRNFRATRPNVTKEQGIAIAQKLFALQINSGSLPQVKELDSYGDRNFLLKGTIEVLHKQEDRQNERYFVLKVTNSIASKNRDLLRLHAGILPFIKNKAIECPVPQTSIFGTKSVLCRVFVSHEYQEDGVREQDSSIFDKEQAFIGSEVTKGIHVASRKEENMADVCAIQLMSFVHGDLLCDMNLTKELLVDFGRKMALLHKTFQEYSRTNSWIKTARFQHPDYPWPMDQVSKTIRKYSGALQDTQREAETHDTFKRFHHEVLEKLVPSDRQLIHADLNEHNVIVGPSPDGQMEVKGFIDFNDLQYSDKLLCIGVALGYLMLEAHKNNLEMIGACRHLLAGYQSEIVLEDSDIDKLLVTAKTRIFQSLVLGAYQHKITPDNTYVLYTQKTGWEVLDKLKLIPEGEILENWKSLNMSIKTNRIS